MALSKKQISTLLQLVSTSAEDPMDCDGCFDHMAEFADAELSGRNIPAALKVVETHLRQCVCCKDEFETLLDGLRGLSESSS
jgi:predicted anti-sigma-YlaC factor YlaD